MKSVPAAIVASWSHNYDKNDLLHSSLILWRNIESVNNHTCYFENMDIYFLCSKLNLNKVKTQFCCCISPQLSNVQ